MSRSGALSHGFKRVWNDPLLFGAELAWRWTFAVALFLLVTYGILLFLNSLPVSDKDLFRLSGILPGLYLDALASIFRGSGPKLIKVTVALLFGGCILWLISSSWGRAITLADLQQKGINVPRVSRFHFLRVLVGLLSFGAYIGSFVFALSLSDRGRTHDWSMFFAIVIPLWLVVTFIRGTLGWWISLAPFIEPRRSVLHTLLAASDVARDRSSQFLWVNFALGCLRLVLAVAALMAAFTALGVFAEVDEAFTWTALALVLIAYSLVRNWINTWELAAYLRVIEWDGTDPVAHEVPLRRAPLLDPPVIPAM